MGSSGINQVLFNYRMVFVHWNAWYQATCTHPDHCGRSFGSITLSAHIQFVACFLSWLVTHADLVHALVQQKAKERWCLIYYSWKCTVWLWCWVFGNAYESDDFGQVGGLEEGYWGGEWVRNLGQWLL